MSWSITLPEPFKALAPWRSPASYGYDSADQNKYKNDFLNHISFPLQTKNIVSGII